MATVNFIPSRHQNVVYLRKLIAYVGREEKTMRDGEWRLITGIDCKADAVFNDFMRVKMDYGRYFTSTSLSTQTKMSRRSRCTSLRSSSRRSTTAFKCSSPHTLIRSTYTPTSS